MEKQFQEYKNKLLVALSNISWVDIAKDFLKALLGVMVRSSLISLAALAMASGFISEKVASSVTSFATVAGGILLMLIMWIYGTIRTLILRQIKPKNYKK